MTRQAHGVTIDSHPRVEIKDEYFHFVKHKKISKEIKDCKERKR